MVMAVALVVLDSCSHLACAQACVSLDTLKAEKRQQLLNLKDRAAERAQLCMSCVKLAGATLGDANLF